MHTFCHNTMNLTVFREFYHEKNRSVLTAAVRQPGWLPYRWHRLDTHSVSVGYAQSRIEHFKDIRGVEPEIPL
ncbi:resistance to complement killing [Salmonella enterica subsp. enterica]|nr:resistance to complement killing [Salmonella enterica subsp. enterica]